MNKVLTPQGDAPMDDAKIGLAIMRYLDGKTITATFQAVETLIPQVRARIAKIDSTHPNSTEAVNEALNHIFMRQAVSISDDAGNQRIDDETAEPDDDIGNRI